MICHGSLFTHWFSLLLRINIPIAHLKITDVFYPVMLVLLLLPCDLSF